MSKFEESNFYKALQDFFINADKKTFLQFLAEFYNRTEGIIDKDNIQDDLIKELRELYLEFNEKGIDENIVREKVDYFLENNVKIKNIISKLDTIPKIKYSISGLNLTIKDFNLNLKDGTTFNFSENTLLLEDNATNEIIVTLENIPKLHSLPRAIHSGCLWLGTATTNNGKTTFKPRTIEFPKTTLERTKNLLSRFNNLLRVGIIGDSISEGAGGTPFWFDLLFNPLYQQNGYNVEYVDNVELHNYAVGSQTADHSMCILGNAFNINNSNASESCVVMSKNYSAKYLDKPALQSEILSKQFDLVLIGIGVNGGSYNAQHLENMVKKLRKNGTEVILITENFRKSNHNYFKDDGLYIKKIADYYGCELADTWSFMYEKRNEDIFADDIHPSTYGQTLWAKGVRSCINKYYQDVLQNDYKKGKRIMNLSSDIVTKFPTRVDVSFNPISHTGTIKAGDINSKEKNPAMQFGAKENNNTIIELTAGQKALFGHSHCCMVSMLYDYNSDANFTIKHVGTTNSITKECAKLGYHRYGTMEELIPLGVHDTIMQKGNCGMAPRLYEITVNSGTLKLIGMMFYTFDYEEIDFEKCIYKGSWNDGEWFNGVPYVKFTDKLNSYMMFDFIGNGCMINFGKCSLGGEVEIYLDGILYKTINMSNGAIIGYQEFIFPYASDDIFQEGESKHTVKIKLKTLNNGEQNGWFHNLVVQNIYIFK